MATREEIAEAIRTADGRIGALGERIAEGAERPLPEGEWRVRDALSHLAATANPVPAVLARVRALDEPGGEPPPRTSNEDQIAARAGASAADLVAEAREGYRAALEALADAGDAELARPIPFGFRPGEAPAGDMLHMLASGHAGGHIDDIEAALA